jgi:hypothetical protein
MKKLFNRIWNLFLKTFRARGTQVIELKLVSVFRDPKDLAAATCIGVDYQNNLVKIYSGIPKRIQSRLWQNRDQWLTKKVLVKHQGETKDSQGNITLLNPVYLNEVIE